MLQASGSRGPRLGCCGHWLSQHGQVLASQPFPLLALAKIMRYKPSLARHRGRGICPGPGGNQMDSCLTVC